MQAPFIHYYPRSPYVALVLSLGMPGLGQIYLSRAADGLVLCLVPNLLLYFCFRFTNAFGVLFSLVMMFIFYFYAALNAYFEAKKLHGPVPLKFYNTPYTYTFLWLFFLGFTLALSNPESQLGNKVVVRAFVTGNGASEPSLLSHEMFFAERFGAMMVAQPDYGDLVVIHDPERVTGYQVRRVVGVPGDRIRIVGGVVFVNGRALPREKVADRPTVSRKFQKNTQPLVETNGLRQYPILISHAGDTAYCPTMYMGKHQYFVLADNRRHFKDSRNWGVLHRSQLVGRVSFLLIPRTLDRFGPIKAWRKIKGDKQAEY